MTLTPTPTPTPTPTRTLILILRRHRCTAHTTTSLSEQISLSFRLSPKPNQVLADRRKVAGKTAGKGAALANAMRQAGKAELSPATAAARDVGANQPAAAVLVNGATAGAAAAAS